MNTATPSGPKEYRSVSIPLSWSGWTTKYLHQKATFYALPVVDSTQGKTHRLANQVSGSSLSNRLSRESPASQNPDPACPSTPRPFRAKTVGSLEYGSALLRSVIPRLGLRPPPEERLSVSTWDEAGLPWKMSSTVAPYKLEGIHRPVHPLYSRELQVSSTRRNATGFSPSDRSVTIEPASNRRPFRTSSATRFRNA